MLSRLNHENVITLHGIAGGCPSTSFDGDNGGFFLVLGLVDDTLHHRLERWRASKHKRLTHRLKTEVSIVNGMEYLHKNDIVFRDLKPQNVGYDQATGKVKLLDFGLALELNEKSISKSAVGTPRYMAPEVALGEAYDFGCDVYPFGIVLWQSNMFNAAALLS